MVLKRLIAVSVLFGMIIIAGQARASQDGNKLQEFCTAKEDNYFFQGYVLAI